MKIPVNLESYPALMEFAEKDKKGFLTMLKAVFTMVDGSVQKGHHEVSKEYFGLEYHELLEQLSDAMFDYEKIAERIGDHTKAEIIGDLLKYRLNPLHAAFSKDDLCNAAGEAVPFEQKFGMTEEEFTVKRWIQGLMFFSFYCDLEDLAKHMSIQDYRYLDDHQLENMDKYLETRPALAYQKQLGILPGKLLKNTGFFDCGELGNHVQCPACRYPNSLVDLRDIVVCKECKGGYEHG